MEQMEQVTKKATKIFLAFLQNRPLNKFNDPELYTDYQEPLVRENLRIYEDVFNLKIVDAGQTVYAIPNPDNETLGYSMREIRELSGTSAKQVDAFLSCYIQMVIVDMFYGGRNANPKQIEFLQIKDIIKRLDERFTDAIEEKEMELANRYSINFKEIGEIWLAKYVSEKEKRTTRVGTVLTIVREMVRQKLLVLVDDDREIRATKRFDDLVRYYYLNQERVQEITKMFEEEWKDA